jgi:Tfp pilus assembly protein PilF
LTEHYEIARNAYLCAIEKEPNEPTYYINLALAYTKLDSTENAVKAYRQAIKEYHPESIGMVHFRLGSLLYTNKKYRQAIAECRRAVELDLSNTEAYFYLALAYDQLKDTKNAIRNYEIYVKQTDVEGLRTDEEQLRQAKERLNFLKKTKQR